MTQIFQIGFSKADLAAMPAKERQLLLLLGHAANEINVFHKLILMSSQGEPPEIKFVDLVQAGQTFILMRTLIGKLHEAWILFSARFLGDKQIRALYRNKLSQEELEALDWLNKQVADLTTIADIRNKFSFHYKDKDDVIESSFQDTQDDDAWHFYMSHKNGNCFYYASELVAQGATIKLAEPADAAADPYHVRVDRAFKRLCSLLINVSERILTLFHGCINAILEERLANTKLDDPTELTNAPTLLAVHIPFFTDEATAEPAA